MDMVCGIYGIFSREDECLYVGLSRDIGQRWRKHLNKLTAGTHPRAEFVEWFDSNGGAEAIVFRVIEEIPEENVSDESLNLAEEFWFNTLQPRFYGTIPSGANKWQHSEETKEKIRRSAVRRAEENGTRNSPDPRNCDYCGRVYTTRARNPSHFCGRSCAARSRRVLSDSDRESIFHKYPGMTQQELAAEYNVNQQDISRAIRSYRIEHT